MKPEIAATRGLALVALVAAASLASPAFLAAQEVRGALAGLAAYEGADRHQRLLEGARREGFLSLYTSFPPEDVATLNAAFEKKYGVKVRAWRAASEKVLQRTVAEARAGRDEVDLVDSNSVPLELLRRQGLLQPVRSSYHADLIPAAVPEHRAWAWARLSVFVQAYNTRGGPARVLRRPPRSALEGKARDRGLRRGLVRRSGADARGRKRPQAVSRPGGEERPVGAQRAQPARADGGIGRSAVRAHRLQFHRRSAQRTRGAARVVHAVTGGRARQRVRGDQARPAPARGLAVLRIHDRRRRPADPRGAQIRSDEQEDPHRAGSEHPENHRPGGSRRSGRALDEALRGNHREGKPVTLLIDNDIVQRVLKPAAARREGLGRDLPTDWFLQDMRD